MIRKLAALVRAVDGRAALAVALVMYGMSMLNQQLTERRDQIDELDRMIADRADQVGQDLWPAPYPARVDVDPLDRAVPEPAGP